MLSGTTENQESLLTTSENGTQRNAPRPESAKEMPRVRLLHAAVCEPEEVRWLWPGWLARGKFHVLTGAPGSGKTTVALSLAALVSAGGFWPDEARNERGDVLIWCGEDAIGDTLLPRLLAAGGKPERVHFVTGGPSARQARPFRPAADLAALAEVAAELPNLRLVILDSVATRAGRPATTGPAAAPRTLAELAARFDCAVLGIARGEEPAAKVAASACFGAVPRIALATVKAASGEEAHRLVRAKSSLGPDEGGLEYRLTAAPVADRGFTALRAQWGAALDAPARELMKLDKPQVEEDRLTVRDSERFLSDMLRAGPRSVSALKYAALDCETAWRTIQRAKVRLGIRAVRLQNGNWAWALPGALPETGAG
jgi:putative DNA primase/helicase